jgi:hypothetical protein
VVDAEVKLLLRGVVVVTRTLLALCAGIIVLVAVATVARPEPRPCRDTVSILVGAAPMCVAPTADGRLVLTSAAAATVLAWVGGGRLQKRLVRS